MLMIQNSHGDSNPAAFVNTLSHFCYWAAQWQILLCGTDLDVMNSLKT